MDALYQSTVTQYQVATDLNFGAAQSRGDFVTELEKLIGELWCAKAAAVLDEETAAEAEYRLSKASREAKKPHPQKKTILKYLNEAKALIEDFAAATGLVNLMAQAVQSVPNVF